MRILLISGHGAGDPGATSNYGVEAEQTIAIVNCMKAHFGNRANVDLYPVERNAYKDLCNGCLQVDFRNYNYIFEAHLNAGVSNQAKDGYTTGTEILVHPSSDATLEHNIVNNVASVGLKNRGVKPRNDIATLNHAKKCGIPYSLFEVCFVDDYDDMSVYYNKFDLICSTIVETMCMQWGLGQIENSGLKSPCMVKQQETLDVGFNFKLPTKEGRFKWLLYDIVNKQWKTLSKWTASNWITLAVDKGQYLVQCQLYDLQSNLVDTKTIGVDGGSKTEIVSTYANWENSKEILLGVSSNNPGVKYCIKLYNTKTKEWFKQFDGQWARFAPDRSTSYMVQFEAHDKDGRLLDSKVIGI